MKIKTLDFKDHLEGNRFRRDTVDTYFAERGFQHYGDYDAFWRALKSDMKAGHIITLDDALWIYVDKERDSPPVQAEESLQDFEIMFDNLLKDLFRRYPHF